MIECRTEGGVTVASCREDITTENMDTFRGEYRDLVASLGPGGAFVLDLAGVERMASAALGLIASSYPDVTRRGARMRIVCISDEVRRLMNVTRLSSVIRVDTDLAAAVRALA